MGTAVVMVEGVLQRDDQHLDYVARPPQQEGMVFYSALTRAYRVVLLSLEPDEARVRWWLQSQGVRDFAQLVLPPLTWTDPAKVCSRLVKALRAGQTDVGLVALSDPSAAATLLQDGVPTVLYTHPRYARPEHRPEGWRGIRPWAEIEAEVDEQKRLSSLERPDTAEFP